MAIAHHPIRTFLQTDGIKFVDVWWSPRPTHIGARIPLIADLIVRSERRGEVAVEFEVVVIGVVAQTGVAIDRHHAEVVAQTESGLEFAPLCFVEGETSHRECGKVGHKGRLFRAGIVEVFLIGVGQTCLCGHIPQMPFGVPRHIKLIGFENQVLHRNPTPLLLLTIFKLLTQILLERPHDVELVVVVDAPFHLALHGEVLRLLERRLDVVGEIAQSRHIGTSCLEAFDELVEVRNLRTVINATALIVDAGK